MSRALAQIGYLPGFKFVANVPGSKSFTNRALIIAAQKVGKTRIKRPLVCDDTKYLAAALNKFGGLNVELVDNEFIVTRTQERLTAPNEPLYLGGAGTPARLIMAFAATVQGDTIVGGNDRLQERPMGHLISALNAIGIRVQELGKPECLPVKVTGGSPNTHHWSIDGSVSSQFVSALILLGAQQLTESSVTIDVRETLVSVPYVEMTLAMLGQCGVTAKFIGPKTIAVTPAIPNMEEITIEPDASGMSYILTAAALTRATVEVRGIDHRSAQGDVGLAKAYARMGCTVDMSDNCITLTGAPLKGIDIDMETMPDVVLSLAIAATQANTGTHVTNIANLRVKECDRIAAIANEMGTLGINTLEGSDNIVVHPGTPKPGIVHCYDDHRVAMAFSLLGLLYPGVEIEDPKCVAKSFPHFWNEMDRFCEEAMAWKGETAHA